MSNLATVAVIFGGQSAEHDVSIQSAAFVHSALDSAGFKTIRIAIDQHGIWRLAPRIESVSESWPEVVMLPGGQGRLLVLDCERREVHADVVFPVLHGPCGEDGSVQGVLRLCSVAYVGCEVLASALCMDKDFAKRLLDHAGLPTNQSLTFSQTEPIDFTTAATELGLPLFVKPVNMGSSIGVSKVSNATEFRSALAQALQFDSRVLLERYCDGREIEVAVLSDNGLQASVPGEVIPVGDAFYSYEAKYIDENGARLSYPADLALDVVDRCQQMAIAASQVLGCAGLVRVDFFLCANGELVINELNTMPGFTQISMYPKLWEASGVESGALIEKLVSDAIVRFQHDRDSHHSASQEAGCLLP